MLPERIGGGGGWSLSPRRTSTQCALNAESSEADNQTGGRELLRSMGGGGGWLPSQCRTGVHYAREGESGEADR